MNGSSLLHRLDLAPCAHADPDQCLLQRPVGFPCAEEPGPAVVGLLGYLEREAWPDSVKVKRFQFSGPSAEIDDPSAEAALLSPDQLSPLWEEIREAAEQGEAALIRLRSLNQVILPTLAFERGGGEIDWAPGCRHSTFDVALALQTSVPGWEEWNWPDDEWPDAGDSAPRT